ncbi:MAG TPA: class I fructose-bisphosphate aldolase [Candidatus Paceibacterota bacterium]
MIDLQDIAQKLMAPGKGLLAADESNESADKRLTLYGIPTGPEMRRQDRDLFLATPGIEQYLTGVILYKETLDQADDKDGIPSAAVDNELFPKLLLDRGIIPGIKVDEGLEPFPESPKETITKGLIGLDERLFVYKTKYGTGFTKWRAVIRIEGDQLPTAQAIHENAKRLASYARLVQAAGMVPILEPEVLLEGTHSRVRSREVLTVTLQALMDALEDQAVDMTAVIVKTAMALSGKDSGRMDTPEEVAEDTVAALMEAVPALVPGIVFLSGGQTTDQATRNLAAIIKEAKAKGAPWPLTFSYARALQDEALRAWGGKEENVPAAREAFLARLASVSEALTNT